MKGNKRYIYSTQNSLWGESECIGFGTTDFYIKEIPKETSKKIIIENHYSKKVCNDAHTHIHLGVFYKEKLMGALQYGYAMNPRSHSNIVKDSEFNEYKELNRMWISDNCVKYAESRAISYSIKYIKKKYPTVKWIQTFADERCGGYGIVYQACSFSYYGEHDSIFYEFEGEMIHNNVVNNSKRKKKKVLEQRGLLDRGIKKTLRQFRYIKFLDKREKKKCLLKEQPYPKHYKELKN